MGTTLRLQGAIRTLVNLRRFGSPFDFEIVGECLTRQHGAHTARVLFRRRDVFVEG